MTPAAGPAGPATPERSDAMRYRFTATVNVFGTQYAGGDEIDENDIGAGYRESCLRVGHLVPVADGEPAPEPPAEGGGPEGDEPTPPRARPAKGKKGKAKPPPEAPPAPEPPAEGGGPEADHAG